MLNGEQTGATGLLASCLKIVWQHLPTRYHQEVAAKLRDINPFSEISTNDDLRRAARLAWISAALQLDSEVGFLCAVGEWKQQAVKVTQFSSVLREKLKELRTNTFDRNRSLDSASTDRVAVQLLEQVGHYISTSDSAGSAPLTTNFVVDLAATVNWPAEEIPLLYAERAALRLPFGPSQSRRSFGDLVFAEFADLVVSPNKYPEAGTAFALSQARMASEVVQRLLSAARGHDQKFDTLADAIAAMPFTSLQERLEQLGDGIAKLEQKIDDLPEAIGAVVRQAIAERAESSVPESTVIALAQSLRLGDQLTREQALAEIRFAVDVASQVLKDGEHPAGHDRLVDVAMRQTADLTSKGLIADSADALDRAIAEMARRDAQRSADSQLRRMALLESKFRQTLLARRPNDAADVALQLGEFELPARPAWAASCVERARALYEEGVHRGSNVSLEATIQIAKAQAAQADSNEGRNRSLNLLGRALVARGLRDTDTRRLEQGLHAHLLALQQLDRASARVEWAKTLSLVGNALGRIGERSRGTGELAQAVDAHWEAFNELRDQNEPIATATTLGNLGKALFSLGERSGDTKAFESAIEVLGLAIEAFDIAGLQSDWFTAQTNLGNALATLGTQRSDVTMLGRGVSSYQTVIARLSREQAPLQWSMVHSNLGNALHALGRLMGSKDHLARASQAYACALEIRDRAKQPMEWATTKANLGAVLTSLGALEAGVERLHEAREALVSSLTVLTPETAPWQHQGTTASLRQVEQLLAAREGQAR